MNPSWHQGKLKEFCKQKGIHVSGWSPLGAYKVFWGSPAVMEDPILQEIAEARKKSVAQVQLIIVFQTISNDNNKGFNKVHLSSLLQLSRVLVFPLLHDEGKTTLDYKSHGSVVLT